jgi:hypothetical protein
VLDTCTEKLDRQKQKPHFELMAEAKQVWETARVKDKSAEHVRALQALREKCRVTLFCCACNVAGGRFSTETSIRSIAGVDSRSCVGVDFQTRVSDAELRARFRNSFAQLLSPDAPPPPHSASRIIETLLKHGTTKQRHGICEELQGKMVELSMSQYGWSTVGVVQFFFFFFVD